MKELLVLLSILACAVAKSPAPYPPSGWRPVGPAFDLPQRNPVQTPPNQEYLPVDPRRPGFGVSDDDDVSVQGLPVPEPLPQFQLSPVSGQEYVGPSFNADIRNLQQTYQQAQVQQQKLRELTRQSQLNSQPTSNTENTATQQVPRQFLPKTITTASTTETAFTSTQQNKFKTDEATDTLNTGEVLNDDDSSASARKVSVEVSKLNLQEYHPELLLSPLTQLSLQPQYAYPGQQLGQLRAPVFFQPNVAEASQKQTAAGFDGPIHLAALQSILSRAHSYQQLVAAQKQQVAPSSVTEAQAAPSFVIIPQQAAAQVQTQVPATPAIPQEVQYRIRPLLLQQAQVNEYAFPGKQPQDSKDEDSKEDDDQQNKKDQTQPPLVNQQIYQPQQEQYNIQTQLLQPQIQYQAQSVNFQNQALIQPNIQYQQVQYQPQQVQYQPQQVQYQPQQVQYQPEQVQYQPQEVQYQPQQVQYQPNLAQYQPEIAQYQPQTQYQPQGFQNQPQGYQVQAQLAYPQAQAQYFQNQPLIPQQVYQQQQSQGPYALQSGIDVNQQGNDIEQTDDKNNGSDDENNDSGSTATAVATAFGARTQPRAFTRYGSPVSREQATDGYSYQRATTESQEEEVTTESGPVVAEANAVAIGRGGRRKSAKLRSRRIRPVFTLDRSGHLVLTEQQ